jgi:hypothetical protein
VVEWTPPDAEGRQGCPVHPDVPRFYARDGGCPRCRSAPRASSDVLTTEMVEADIEMERVFVQDAEDAGVDDMLELERYGAAAREAASRDADECAELARKFDARGQALLDGAARVTIEARQGGGTVNIEASELPGVLDAIALKWFTLAKEYRALVKDHRNSQGKLVNANSPMATARYRAKAAMRLAVLKAKGSN